jgi:rubredoxin
MPRRESKNETNIPRLDWVPNHDIFSHYVCVKCSHENNVHFGDQFPDNDDVYENAAWECKNCNYVHSKQSPLPVAGINNNPTPYASWPADVVTSGSLPVERFWQAFFRNATENAEVFWKQCNTCGRILPNSNFSRHKDWGPLEKQMECRACKAVINALLNPKRTKQQLYESSVKRRTAELLMKEDSEAINIDELFDRFNGKCFKTGQLLDKNNRGSWAVDHILPSKWLYPLSISNAALLSTEANANKSDMWPSKFYSNEELKNLAEIAGANLALISRKDPIINENIDVDACVGRFLTVRSATDLEKRIEGLHKLLEDYGLSDRLSDEHKKMLGLS